MVDNQNKCVVVLSGGMDSALCMAIAKADGYKLSALHLNYGQLTEKREEKAFLDICEFYGVEEKIIVDTSFFKQIGGSGLTDNKIGIEEANLENETIPSTYVPFRNGNILAIAASWAEVIGATTIFIGAVQQDSSGYPDCRKEFFDEFEKAINTGTKPETNIKILTPIINFSKGDIVRRSNELCSPLHLTWSCYRNSDTACGTCDSCALRLRGFQQEGLVDPIPYLVRPEYAK
ncbi:MAG: 7-cyano-7-deazaguanine synthase QueC [bacterium]